LNRNFFSGLSELAQPQIVPLIDGLETVSLPEHNACSTVRLQPNM
jgi:hypothetical protein